MSNGKFFEKRASAEGGRFFRDLPGRENGNFHKEAIDAYGPGVGAAMSGQMGGSFGVGSSATGGGMYGTGSGAKKKPAADSKVAKNSVTIMPGTGDGEGTEKKADPLIDHDAHGWHRPADQQPRALDSSGSRFLQDDNGSVPVTDGVAPSGLSGAIARGKGRGRMSKHGSDLRFLGTSFEKKAGDPDITGTVRRDIGQAPSSAREWGGRVSRSAHQGAQEGWDYGRRKVSEGANAIAGSPALSLLAMIGGGVLAGRGLKKGVKAIGKAVKRKKLPEPSMYEKIQSKLTGRHVDEKRWRTRE